jgi:hypothetical protein
MQYKWIENCHMKNVILRKDFNLATTSSFFHSFTFEEFKPRYEVLTCVKLQEKLKCMISSKPPKLI